VCDECRYPGELAKQEPDEEPGGDRPTAAPEPLVIYSDEPPFLSASQTSRQEQPMAFPIAARFAHPGNGYEGDQRLAAEHLEVGKVYVVTRLEVGRSSSALFLDIPNGPTFGFNTVMFEPASVYDVDGAIGPDDDETGDGAGQCGDGEGTCPGGC
jgi:hypothetical protein